MNVFDYLIVGAGFAGSVLATVPLLAIFFAFQRRLMDGIMAGAIKG